MINDTTHLSLIKYYSKPCQPIGISAKRKRTSVTHQYLTDKHQTDSLPVRFGGKEGTEELCFSLFCYTGAIIYHFNRGRSDCTDYNPTLLDKENKYKLKMMEIIEKRLHALWDNTGFTLIKDPLRVGYYTEIDMLVWAKKFYGDDFVEYLKRTYSPLNVVFRLAKETSLVLLNGGGFDGPEWSIRASLANLNEKDYVVIGQGIKRILDEYAKAWKKTTEK